MSCECRTVSFTVLITADDFDAATAEAGRIAEDLERNDSKFWVTASQYSGAVNRAGCLAGDCVRPPIYTCDCPPSEVDGCREHFGCMRFNTRIGNAP